MQHGGLHLWHPGGGPATRLDPSHSQDVHQQKSGTGDQQLARRRGGGSRLMILHFSSRVVYMQLMSRYFIPSSAECCWRGRGRLSLRPGGHRASCLGRSHRWELGRTHQSGRDVPPKKRGERRLEVKKKVWETCQMLNSSLLSILTRKPLFVSGSHTPAVVPLQWFLNWADWQGEDVSALALFDEMMGLLSR